MLWPWPKGTHLHGLCPRALSCQGFSSGSYTGLWIIDTVLRDTKAYHIVDSVLGALAFPPNLLSLPVTCPDLCLLHVKCDTACCVDWGNLATLPRILPRQRVAMASG